MTKVCPRCGFENPDNVYSCQRCGYPLIEVPQRMPGVQVQSQPTYQQQFATREKPKFPLLQVAVPIIAGFIIIAILLSILA
ncbi:hypothetical protein CM19_07175 [Candidatus Acidianus copahuensis]|uniref:Zinc-ribbon domain-containing protein n=1 Tax=Candidatus Acidianus copahuensis TaxID=1160895 RepID=A0A031LLY1_9CREN|nr:zinc-ribbon domain-containing protein [Candidatus Acidianus copahuensis]EZQ06663.1 hypothetical protein CM19_07175 [Candidatus Acidianus copahuensis]